jgi:hypothetical protein
MSWPLDGKPRFIVTELSGYSDTGSKPVTDVMVDDRASRWLLTIPSGAFPNVAKRRRLAHELAGKLNEDAAGTDLGDYLTSVSHGTWVRYSKGCRCDECKAAGVAHRKTGRGRQDARVEALDSFEFEGAE